jgi:hypothetical protein
MWPNWMWRVLMLLAVALALGASGTLPASAGKAPSAGELLPDLEQEMPSDLRVSLGGSAAAPSYWLGFRSAVRNVGDGPLIISGHRSPGTPTMTADQLVERRDGSTDVVAGVGFLRYVHSPDHDHWHYLGFDRYELRRAGSSKILEYDGKTGFCLGDRYPVTTVRVANAAPLPVYTGRCGLYNTSLLSIEEGISVGWGDDYPAFIEFQDLPLDGLPAGRYVLVHRVNVDGRLRELSYANDAASLLLDLRWRGGVPHLNVLALCPNSAICDNVPAPGQPWHESGSFVSHD